MGWQLGLIHGFPVQTVFPSVLGILLYSDCTLGL